MKLGYVVVYVADVGAAINQYHQAFGLEVRFLHESGMYAELATGATVVAFASEQLACENGLSVVPNRRHATAPAMHLSFVVEDVPHVCAAAVAAGMTLEIAPMQKPWGQIVAYLRDDNGCYIEVCTAVT